MLHGGKKVDEFLQQGLRTGQGLVVWHDRTVYELGRICIETTDRYPELETWINALERYGMVVQAVMYSEKSGKPGVSGYLWLFYISPKRIVRTAWDDRRRKV